MSFDFRLPPTGRVTHPGWLRDRSPWVVSELRERLQELGRGSILTGIWLLGVATLVSAAVIGIGGTEVDSDRYSLGKQDHCAGLLSHDPLSTRKKLGG